MKLFDIFKSKPSISSRRSEKTQDNKCQKIQYETKIPAKKITSSQEVIEMIVSKMVKEDPFKNFYTGKKDAYFTPMSKRVYKYDAITTVNVDLVPQNDTFTVSLEGISIGTLPESISGKLSEYYDQFLLTAYAYVVGGYYKEYDTTEEKIIEVFEPYDIDIYVQFT
ncbi:hypothetical protein [Marinilactibacillus sp. Marseille-P9653]|uniref:hypothetical protein n=1 Tax=Marinilactibacillus sp. Marseille-P9653 TaxID=2866583 RepID=UPI001CE3EC08|nr:hypothetical protein [Marinilactibacillus sp. Marseille-P9653]